MLRIRLEMSSATEDGGVAYDAIHWSTSA